MHLSSAEAVSARPNAQSHWICALVGEIKNVNAATAVLLVRIVQSEMISTTIQRSDMM